MHFANTSPPSGCVGDYTPKLLNMLDTQLCQIAPRAIWRHAPVTCSVAANLSNQMAVMSYTKKRRPTDTTIVSPVLLSAGHSAVDRMQILGTVIGSHQEI